MEETPLPSGKNFRSQLAAAARSISWTYAIFWSISTSCPGVMTWKDGFYNGEIKTRKITSSMNLTADELVLQRSEQLRELYDSLISGECGHRARRPVAALSPEDLGDTELYYLVCMTYAFCPGQGLPGKSFASNEYVWLSNAQSADRKLFHRALIAKSASIKTIVCVPFIMHGVLELGTTDPVSEDPALVDRITASLWDTPPRAAFSSEAGVADIVVFEDLDHGNTAVEATTTMVPGEPEPHAVAGGEVAECESNAHNDLEQITMDDIGELYSLCEELDVLDDDSSSWVADPWSSFQLVPTAEATDVDDAVVAALGAIDGSCRPSPSSFVAWKRTPDSDEVQAVPLISGEPPQKLLKKAVAGAGAWMNNADGSAATMTTDQGSSIKNHVMSERRRREKLKEMFLILKSVVPSIHKVDKASILAETIAYLKELEKRVEELESSSQPSPRPMETTRRRCCKSTGKKVSAGARAKRKAPAPEDTDGERRHCVSNVNVTIMDNKELLLELQCQWKELLMTRVFDAIKGVSLDVLSVQASTSDGLLGLKIQAKFASPAAVEPGMITEALRKAIAS
ncbi:anthocyanin regulatory Lc protein [Oryza sativa Japonica Group]|uniref:anthocyanin regulatory Lc protein n=1 Tax=Oryza sativa subsp. japonica TaxID=39947 RepID=UPI00077543DA|nr:anthocyanin regulatory Lc protein [Oryza sativa Japonica Group]